MSMRPAPMPTPPRARSGSDSRFLQATRRMSIAVDVLRGGRRDLRLELGDAGLDGISGAVDQLADVHPEDLSGSKQGRVRDHAGAPPPLLPLLPPPPPPHPLCPPP